MAEVAAVFPGEVMITKDTEHLLAASEDGIELIRGANIGRYYFEPNPKQGEALFLNLSDFVKGRSEDSKAFHHLRERVCFQRCSAIDNFRRLIATIIPAHSPCLGTVSYLWAPKYDNSCILAMLNSECLEWRFGFTSTNNYVIALTGRRASGWTVWKDKQGRTLDGVKRQAPADQAGA